MLDSGEAKLPTAEMPAYESTAGKTQNARGCMDSGNTRVHLSTAPASMASESPDKFKFAGGVVARPARDAG